MSVVDILTTQEHAPRVAVDERVAYLLVRGILWQPGFARDWTDRMSTMINTRTSNGVADNFQYYVGPITRNFRDTYLAEQFSEMLAEYTNAGFDGPRLVIAAHSNGADVVLDALRLLAYPRVKALHLFSPAVDALAVLSARNVEELHVYHAGRDWALGLAQTVAGKALGFGSVARDIANLRTDPRVRLTIVESFGHDSWFAGAATDATFRHITGGPIFDDDTYTTNPNEWLTTSGTL
jgi:hypothetical protein